MQTKLISVTKSYVIGIDTPEDLIVYTARVSNPENQMNMETSDRLVKYLIKHKHWSPFEMVDLTVMIKTSRAIAAQILRHRSFSFQEFSQRYSAVAEIETIQLRAAGATNRQSSLEPCNPTLFNSPLYAEDIINEHLENSQQLYEELINKGVAKECARMVLPLATETTLYVKGSLRSWLTYLNVRLDVTTQLEHREIALSIADLIQIHFPNVTNALNNFNNKEGLFI
jgi:thymidylate synthase (FAD)